MNRFVTSKIRLFLLLFPLWVSAQEQQTLTLPQAQAKAMEQYPLTKQRKLLQQTSALTISNLSKGFLPQLTLSGQASYQSDVTRVNFPFPNVNIEPLSNDQYRMVLDVNQLVYDGGAIVRQKQLQQVNRAVEEEKIEVEYQKLRERINQLYLGILLTEQQLKLVSLVQKDLELGIQKVQAQIENGTAFRSYLAVLQAELLKTEQRMVELNANRLSLIAVLGLFLNQTLPDEIQFEQPAFTPGTYNAIERSELKVIQLQDSILKLQFRLVDVRNRPRISLFAQGGYGRPGLNMLKNVFDPYYITGIRFNWALSNFYTAKKEKQLVTVGRQNLEVQKEYFLLSTNVQLKQQQGEIEKYRKLIATDQQIVTLREQVKTAAAAQLENGVLNAGDYIREVNAEDQARQNLIFHQLQLLQAYINYNTLLGK